MCLWWVPLQHGTDVFVGRVAYWADADHAMISRKTGSMVRAHEGCYFAVVTPPHPPVAIDDAIDVTAAASTARNSALAASPPLQLESSDAASPAPPTTNPTDEPA